MTDPLEMNVRMVGRADDLRKHNQVKFRTLQKVAMDMFDAVAVGGQKDAISCIVGYLDSELSAAEDYARKSEINRMQNECKAWRSGVLDAIQRTIDNIHPAR